MMETFQMKGTKFPNLDWILYTKVTIATPPLALVAIIGL